MGGIEVRFKLADDNKKPIGVYFKEQKEANKLIEEFMLLANKSVAKILSNNQWFNVYRIHDTPNMEKLQQLVNVCQNFGHDVKIEGEGDELKKSINQLLKEIKGTPEENMIETLVTRCMSKAKYTIKNIGHYGLAFDYYSHFTSPIRRYPDVMVHRLLQFYLDGGKSVDEETYETKCLHSSNMESLATHAERDSIKYMQVRYMQDHKDQEFLGVISGVTEWGIFVEIIENKCEGMVRIREIKDDYYTFDEKQYALVGATTHNLLQLGDEIYVKAFFKICEHLE
jgi:ribonuclease R